MKNRLKAKIAGKQKRKTETQPPEHILVAKGCFWRRESGGLLESYETDSRGIDYLLNLTHSKRERFTF